jgi:hypothetical protein
MAKQTLLTSFLRGPSDAANAIEDACSTSTITSKHKECQETDDHDHKKITTRSQEDYKFVFIDFVNMAMVQLSVC